MPDSTNRKEETENFTIDKSNIEEGSRSSNKPFVAPVLSARKNRKNFKFMPQNIKPLFVTARKKEPCEIPQQEFIIPHFYPFIYRPLNLDAYVMTIKLESKVSRKKKRLLLAHVLLI